MADGSSCLRSRGKEAQAAVRMLASFLAAREGTQQLGIPGPDATAKANSGAGKPLQARILPLMVRGGPGLA